MFYFCLHDRYFMDHTPVCSRKISKLRYISVQNFPRTMVQFHTIGFTGIKIKEIIRQAAAVKIDTDTHNKTIGRINRSIPFVFGMDDRRVERPAYHRFFDKPPTTDLFVIGF